MVDEIINDEPTGNSVDPRCLRGPLECFVTQFMFLMVFYGC